MIRPSDPAEQRARARFWNSQRTNEPAPRFCVRCNERIRAEHNTVVTEGWYEYHARRCNRAPSHLEQRAPGVPA